MKGIIKIIILFLIFIYANNSKANTINIIYTIDNNPITNVEINNEITYLKLLSKELQNMDDESLVMYASKSIIREKIKEIEILKYFKFGLNDEVVNQNLSRLISSLGIKDISEFEKEIKNLNLSKEYIKKKIEIEILWNQIIFNKYKNKLSIDENKIKNNLKDRLNNEKNEIEEYYLFEILFSPSSTSKIKEELEKIKNSINEIGFENTARVFSTSASSSNGGDIGWIQKNQLSKQIASKIENLENSEVSDVIDVPGGKLIIMLKDKRKLKVKVSFDEEFKKALMMERNKQLNRFSTIYFKKVELNTVIDEK
tara:strand:- start:243 stop:1178 length:936 start_codon:yes stop_codon:yes gene_type:complete